MKRWVLAIADDLTGALEAGAKFASRGLTASVLTRTSMVATPDVSVLVIDSETRHLPEDQAFSIIRDLAVAASPFQPSLVYKKTDSTLRGNIAAELRALLEILPDRRIIYSPAYPDMGRTVCGGRLFVDGVPVHQSAFATDSLNPVHESDIGALLNGVPATVLDGKSNADVQAAAQTISASPDPVIAAGPAALAGALAECLDLDRKETRGLPKLPRCLVVNGSMHPVSAAQIEFAQNHGCFQNGWRYIDDHGDGSGSDRAIQTGDCIRRVVESSQIDGIVIFGGDTAFGIHQALGSRPFDPYGEIMTGVPVSRCGDLFWITKAGGFGAPDMLCNIQRKLT